ncbi:MAG: hypothetical protein ACRYGM_07175 [Janthinobacterium lividum]
MNTTSLLCGIAVVVSAGLTPVLARAEGPCTSDIAQLGRKLGDMNGVGAPVSEPDAGQHVGTPGVSGLLDAAQTTSSDHNQPGGASRIKGGSFGTVGGVAGAIGSSAGSASQNAVMSGAIATSAADVRLQSEGKPTMAQQAISGSHVETDASDQVSEAKMILQKAVDLNASNDASCLDSIAQVRGKIAAR